MIRPFLFTTIYLAFLANNLYAQAIMLDKKSAEPVHVSVWTEKIMGKNALRAIKDSTIKAFDEPTFIRIKNSDFKDGVVEVKVLSRLLKNAPDFARGFIGVAFRINDDNSRYESIYIRPVNARVEDQVRRNHSIQYYSYPDYKFDRLRKEAPERYESYSDLEMNKWITLRIEVLGTKAKCFINNSKQPALVVTDLKLGPAAHGAIGLWVEEGTEGYFSDLKITKQH